MTKTVQFGVQLLLVCGSLLVSSAQASALPIKTLEIGGAKVRVEIAETDASRTKGLMYRRTELKENEGMLFVFDNEEPRSFWMKNTFIPLSIGFFNKDRELVDIQDMDPVSSEMETPKTYSSQGPAQTVLEVPRGWFKRHKVTKGLKYRLHP